MSWVYFLQESPRPEHTVTRSYRGQRTRYVRANLGGPYGSGLIKIGFCEKHPAFRAREIAGQVRRSIAVLGVMAGGYCDEQRLHRVFAHLRVSKLSTKLWINTEWFRPEPELTNFISSLPTIFKALAFECDGHGCPMFGWGASTSAAHP